MATAYDEVRSAVAAGLDPEDRPQTRDIATVLMALFDGLALQWLIDPDAIASADVLVEALTLIAVALDGDNR